MRLVKTYVMERKIVVLILDKYFSKLFSFFINVYSAERRVKFPSFLGCFNRNCGAIKCLLTLVLYKSLLIRLYHMLHRRTNIQLDIVKQVDIVLQFFFRMAQEEY
jgi:hypothetical protein